MSVIFIIHILVLIFWVFFVCGICVYCFASINPTALIILNLDIYQEKKNNEKKKIEMNIQKCNVDFKKS